MKLPSHLSLPVGKLLRVFLFAAAVIASDYSSAQEAALTAKDLAEHLSAGLHDGSSAIRLKMEIRPPAGGAKINLQLLVKSRRSKSSTELIYQVLWPKERAGESFLLRKASGQGASGAVFLPPDKLRPLSAPQMDEPMLGSDLTYEDLVEDFFSWDHQTLLGAETLDRVPCQIIESKPGKGEHSSYARVRSWIDLKKLIPMKVEKYLASGAVARRIETTRVAKDDGDHFVTASLTIHRPEQDSVTVIEGSSSRHDVSYKAEDFTPEALRANALLTPGKK